MQVNFKYHIIQALLIIHDDDFLRFRLANPMLLGLLIGFFTSNPHNFSNNDAYLIATGIVLTLGLPLLFFHPFMLFLFEEGMKLRIACCSLIYSKVGT